MSELQQRPTIPLDLMMERLERAEQLRDFFAQMWLENPELARKAGQRVMNWVSPQ